MRSKVSGKVSEMSNEKKKKVVITGDDILIEYVRRIKNFLKKIDKAVEG